MKYLNQFLYVPKKLKSKIVKILSIKTNTIYMANLIESHYLGKKGYTIAKSSLSEKELLELKKNLTLKPQLPGQQFAGGVNINQPFPVFRENEKKIYIPRFFGIEKYGEPVRDDLDPGEDIDLKFERELRDYQENIVLLLSRKKWIKKIINALTITYGTPFFHSAN